MKKSHSVRYVAFFLIIAAVLSVGSLFYFSNGEADVVKALVSPSAGDPDKVSVELQPHKALYNIELINTKSGSQIVNVSGQMLYEWYPDCGGWVSNHRFDLLYEYADNPAMRITSDFATYESFDGKTMSFSTIKKRDGELFQEVRGQAMRSKKGIEVTYSKPIEMEETLPEAVLFPTGHTIQLLKEMEKGRKFFHATIFDGSDEEGMVDINTFIGKTANPMAHVKPSSGIDTTLVNTQSHDMRLAFFPEDEDGAEADYEMSVVFHKNGIISNMVVEYSDFSVAQKLVALEALKNICENK